MFGKFGPRRVEARAKTNYVLTRQCLIAAKLCIILYTIYMKDAELHMDIVRLKIYVLGKLRSNLIQEHTLYLEVSDHDTRNTSAVF